MHSQSHSCVRPSVYNLLVESPGSCGSSVIHRFAQLSGQPQAAVARCFFQAPGVLMKGLPKAEAHKLNELLTQAGACTRVVDSGAEVDTGVGEWEIALTLPRTDAVGKVFQSLVDLLQVQPEQAVQLLCQSPAVVMGNLSEVAVTALRERFEGLGATVDVSRPEHARYDLYLDPKDGSSRRWLEQQLQSVGTTSLSLDRDLGQPSGLLALGLDWVTLQQHRDAWMRHISGLKILNREYARYDLVLHETGPMRAGVSDYLQANMGIPGQAVPRILDALPVVIGRGLSHAQQAEHLSALADLKASAKSHLLSWQCFSLKLNTLGDRQQLAPVLRLLGGLSTREVERWLAKPAPWHLEGPFTDLQARWLRKELDRQGCSVDILKI